MMVSFGTSSGPIPPNDGGIFGAKGSLYFTRPSIAHYMARRDQLEPGAAALFDMLQRGVVTSDKIATYKLADAAQAQADLEARKTVGSLVLTV
jgi:NADPH2:quinone reductase